MANHVTCQVTGGTPKVIEADTVQEALDALGLSGKFTATVNGTGADLEDELNDYSFVTFAESVKGGTLR